MQLFKNEEEINTFCFKLLDHFYKVKNLQLKRIAP